MGAQLRVYRGKISSASVTKKITRAMELISASRIIKSREKCNAFAPYARAISRAVSTVLGYSDEKHPLITPSEQPKRAAVLVFASDRGLAGAFNAQVMREAVQLGDNLAEHLIETDYYLIGRKAVNFFNFRKIPFVRSWVGQSENPTFDLAQEISRAVFYCFLKHNEEELPAIDSSADDGFAGSETRNPVGSVYSGNSVDSVDSSGGAVITAAERVDEVYVVFNRFVNMVTQIPVAFRLLPMDVIDETTPQATSGESDSNSSVLPLYTFEPDVVSVLDELLKEYVESRIFDTLLHSATAKHAATQRAMKSASDNADKLIEKYTRLANNARQAEITQQISEIIGGAGDL